MELWGGHECTVNRVGDRYRDQTLLTGHQDRPTDLARFAALGITRLRYPVLWERVAPDRPDEHDWRWSDERLAEIARLGMAPIVGLLHHGSGPRYTSLVADDLVPLFAGHAAAVAERYPHVEDWTPVNEPLTTARFSALYGFWYPHARDDRLFWTALVNQVDATRAAMRAIRAVNPAARLVQTEDLGQYYSTPELRETAAAFNDRRWATWDLLTGRVTRDHPLWPPLAAMGLVERLRAIADDPCPPDVIGVNFYPTSERFLDHRLDAYPYDPPEEGFHDLTAARVMDPPTPGLAGLLRQAWDRYRLPIAVTESHLGCSREEQLRWLWQSWQACRDLAAQGVDVRAMTAWALLGNVDWNSLITIEAQHYEPGAFDVSGPVPRPTAIARLLATIGSGATPTAADFPGIDTPGWWQRAMRLEHPPVVWTEVAHAAPPAAAGRPVAITGAAGALGRALAGECAVRALSVLAVDGPAPPMQSAAAWLDEERPWAVIDAAADRNDAGAVGLALACAERGIRYLLVVPDDAPLGAADRGSPPGVDGDNPAEAAARIADRCPAALVIRTGSLFSPDDDGNPAMAMERTWRAGGIVAVPDGAIVSPTYLPDFVRACLDLVVDDERGLWRLTNGGGVSWLGFARMIAAALDLDADRVAPAHAEQPGGAAARPDDAALAAGRGQRLPDLADAVARHAAVRRRAC